MAHLIDGMMVFSLMQKDRGYAKMVFGPRFVVVVPSTTTVNVFARPSFCLSFRPSFALMWVCFVPKSCRTGQALARILLCECCWLDFQSDLGAAAASSVSDSRPVTVSVPLLAG